MKNLTSFVLTIKSLASMIFTGLILLYMVAGWLYTTITRVPFNDTIPFMFLIQGVFLAIAIAILWVALLSDDFFKKIHYSIRLFLFVFLLVLILTAFLLMFYAHPMNWAKLWLIVAAAIVGAAAVLSMIGEICFRITGKKYTEILDLYKKDKINNADSAESRSRKAVFTDRTNQDRI